MNRTITRLSIFAVAVATFTSGWWLRPTTTPGGQATSSRLYSIALPNHPRPDTFSETLTAAGFIAVPDASFNSLLPPSYRKPEFESLPAFRREEALPPSTRLIGYRPGGTSAHLFVQTAGSQERVQAFQRETESLHAELSK